MKPFDIFMLGGLTSLVLAGAITIIVGLIHELIERRKK